MATLELYSKGASVWIPDPDAVWVSAQLLRDYNAGEQHVLLQLSDGRELDYPVASPSDLPPLGNPDILEGENDLTALSFLHEPAVLHNLRVRFLDYSSIYTYCGIVLVAINPYDQLSIYGEEVIDAYSGQDMADMEPHIFSVAEDAYRTMTREEKNQSIIISGESGSGKTVSAKFTMRFFAVVGGAAQQTSVEERVLASNPIMESFGNAKTTRNDNSSRFGKYIEIGFGRKGDIIGANMKTYLLEKSRVIFQASAERNYHIFYQLCASRELPEMRSLKLDAPERFRYTSQGGEMNIPGTDDVLDLERTRNAFTILGVQADQQMELFRILAAVLHLGNLNIQASGRGGDRSYINTEDRSLAVFSKLLGVEGPQVAHWLCHRRLAVGGEMLVKPMSGQQAVEARDALAKHIYGQMFTWTVHRLNAALRSQMSRTKSFIGVLDIYGFETFERNSFEQFCINYANEKLQQQFNRHVFQLEQEEYVREELAWSRIEFSDNQMCINLIEGQLGLFDLLDEECRMPKGSDESWARKLYDQHLNGKIQPHFRKPRMSNSAFIVLHFADSVQYECDGFLDKNRDTVFVELVNILRASQVRLLAELFQQDGNAPSLANGGVQSGKRSHREHKLTVGFQFRQSLQQLMDTLNSTTPHYVRCIKPNDLKEPFMFDPKRTVQQLRACGVLETIRISAAGYPSRWTYEEFFGRYRVLLRGPQSLEQARDSCRQELPQLIPDPEQYCFGKTKVFFRAGQVALLERLRADRLRAAAMVIQTSARGWLARLKYARILWATVTVQRYCRGALARRLALTLRYTKAALVIQKTFRMVMVRQMFFMIRQATITIQAFTRGTLARYRYRQLLSERAAVLLQATVRGWLARRAFRRTRAAVVFMQCCARRKAARRELLKLKAEARSVEKFRELNKGMEVKLMQLQLRVDQQVREGVALRESLHIQREASGAELEALKATIRKLESQKQEQVHLGPVVNDNQVEERKRAEEKATEEILQLTQEVQALQKERSSVGKEKEDLTAQLLVREKEQEGSNFIFSGLLENQLSRQHRQWTEELEALRCQQGRIISESSSAAQGQGLQELLEVRELECVRLRRELKELRISVALRRLVTQTDLLHAPPPPAPEDSIPSGPKPASVTGLLECRKKDETKLLKNLITDIRGNAGLSLPAGLPAAVLFLCVRQADCSGDRSRTHALCAAAVTAIKGAVKKHSNDVDMTAMWLKNACLLQDLLTQHSPKQTLDSEEMAPLTTDLSDLTRALSDLCIQAYQQLLSITEKRLQNIIVPALLESETIPGLSGSGAKLGGSRKRAGSDPRPAGGDAPTMASVLRELGSLHSAMSHQALVPALMEQAFHQLTYLITATTFNSLLLRKDVCCWSRGIQIRYNVSLLQEWLHTRSLQAGGAVATLEPLIQAVQLLQVGKKTDADARALVQTCSALSSQQIVKILTLYSDLEERVTLNFIRSVQGLLKGRVGVSSKQLLMDVRRVFPVTFPYSPPAVLHADELDIPDFLKISFLRRA
ncbi:unconventional myosin-Va [Genypterus blacodes]|uniref:unconventional myosin-Va n=1 Tax=Genypterus blacodes TaxID=154954 RepID=UPI003F773272